MGLYIGVWKNECQRVLVWAVCRAEGYLRLGMCLSRCSLRVKLFPQYAQYTIFGAVLVGIVIPMLKPVRFRTYQSVEGS
jgi:hypothetical protein